MLIWIGISISVKPFRRNSGAILVYTDMALNRVTEVTLSVLFPVVGTSTSTITILLGFIVDPFLAKMEINLSFSSSSGKSARVMLSLNQSKSNDLKKDHEPNKHGERIHNKQMNYNLLTTPST